MPSRPEQVLRIQPPTELTFKGEFEAVKETNLVLSNPTSSRVAFKVKTTAPRQYCVRPNTGIIVPEGDITIQVMLQPSREDDANDPFHDPSKHKFLVQSVLVNDEPLDYDSLWSTVNKSSVMESKLRCVFIRKDAVTNSTAPTASGTSDVGAFTNLQMKGDHAYPNLKTKFGSVEKFMMDYQKLQTDYDSSQVENSKMKEKVDSLTEKLQSVTGDLIRESRPYLSNEQKLMGICALIISLVIGIVLGTTAV